MEFCSVAAFQCETENQVPLLGVFLNQIVRQDARSSSTASSTSILGLMADKRLFWVSDYLRSLPLLRSTEFKQRNCCTGLNTDVLIKGSEKDEEMGSEVQSPPHFQDAIAIVSLLKGCAQRKDLHQGSQLHQDILEHGVLEKNMFVGNTLLSMYAKCGALEKVQEVFDQLAVPDVVSWTVLISAYAQHGNGEQALHQFDQMQHMGLSPNAVTFSYLLKACGSIGATESGRDIHAEIARKGFLANNPVLGSALIDMYVKFGALTMADQVFEELPSKNVVLWNTLIAGLCQHEQGEEALRCFERMKCEGFSPDAVTFSCILRACGSVGAAEKGKEIHEEIIEKGLFETDIVLGNALVDMYAKCGVLTKAQQVFDELGMRDAISWNALITGYCQHGHGEEALNCFEQMKCNGLSPSPTTLSCMLKACGSIGIADKGREIHTEILKKGLLGNSTILGNALVDMYAKCGALAKAQQVFDELPVRDVLSWSALIAEYCHHEQGEEALKCFQRMRQEGLSPDVMTFTFILKACGSTLAAGMGEEIHAEIVSKGLLGNGTVLGNALVDMYAKCGSLAKAQEVFDKLSVRDVVSWNALITGYAQHGNGEQVLNCLEQMKREGLFPDAITFPCILKACGSLGASEKGEGIHVEIVRRGLLATDIVLGNALVDMYAKCGVLVKAQEVFDELFVRDEVSWNALIAGYCEHGHGEEALFYFEKMKEEGVSPDAVTFACILKACGCVGLVEKGEETHSEIVRKKLLGNDILLGNALVDMYAKCGALAKAKQVFDALPVRNVASWTGLIAGYCEHGHCEEALSCFEQMKGEGLSPDALTFTCILKACSSLGAADKGQMYYETMSTSYGITPSLEHYTCMVDLFSRAGHFDKAMEMMKKMPTSEHLPAWFAMLSACSKWGNVKFGNFAFEHAVRLDEESAVPYILMSKIYAAAGMQRDADKIEALRYEKLKQLNSSI